MPFANLSLSPATLALHYGQTVFEGMKAFAMKNGRSNIFRIEKHYDRFVKSLERMCMAPPPKEFFINGLISLVETDKTWVPNNPALCCTCAHSCMQAKQNWHQDIGAIPVYHFFRAGTGIVCKSYQSESRN
ncbi:MAG: hypothetical protein ACXWWC_13905 [Chitinophagaceae bacterium]